MFIHVERFTFRGGTQQYEKPGKRVYVAYDSETAELKTIIVASLPLFDEPPEDWFGTETPITGAVGTDILARQDCRTLGLYGTGRQTRRHLIAMCKIRPSIEAVRVLALGSCFLYPGSVSPRPQTHPPVVANTGARTPGKHLRGIVLDTMTHCRL